MVDDLGGGSEPASSAEAPKESVELVDRPSAYENLNQYEYGGLPDASTESSSLRMPALEEPDPSKSKPASQSSRLPDAVPPDLFRESAAPQASPRARLSTAAVRETHSGPPTGLLAVLALGVVVMIAGAYFALRGPPAPVTGMLSVVSDPEGAEVLLGGAPTGQVTPAQFDAIEVGNTLVQVRKEGFAVEPEVRPVEVKEGQMSTVFFRLVAVRTVTVRTEPPGADVRLNGRPVSGRTPLRLPALRVGQVARIDVEMPGYIPVEIERTVAADAAELETVTLQEAALLDVTTEPAGATVRIGDRSLGETPLYEAPVARGERILVRVSKPGFKTISRRIRVKDDFRLELSLREAPLLSLPLKGQDRAEARRIDRELGAANRRLASAKRAAQAAERKLQRLIDDPNSMFGARARAERAVDTTSSALIAAEDAIIEARARADRFRARVTEDD